MPVHICTGTVAIVHKCTIMHKLMGVFFSSNCVKSTTFFILHNYDRADVIALYNKTTLGNSPFGFLFLKLRADMVKAYVVIFKKFGPRGSQQI